MICHPIWWRMYLVFWGGNRGNPPTKVHLLIAYHSLHPFCPPCIATHPTTLAPALPTDLLWQECLPWFMPPFFTHIIYTLSTKRPTTWQSKHHIYFISVYVAIKNLFPTWKLTKYRAIKKWLRGWGRWCVSDEKKMVPIFSDQKLLNFCTLQGYIPFFSVLAILRWHILNILGFQEDFTSCW